LAAGQIILAVDLAVSAAERAERRAVGIVARCEGRARVTIVATADGVHEITSQTDQLPSFMREMQRHRRNLKTSPDSAVTAVVVVVRTHAHCRKHRE
jgi:hypothetical protein